LLRGLTWSAVKRIVRWCLTFRVSRFARFACRCAPVQFLQAPGHLVDQVAELDELELEAFEARSGGLAPPNQRHGQGGQGNHQGEPP